MPKTIQEYCHDALDRVIEEGLLADYTRTGRFRAPRVRNPLIPMDQWELLHYATCEGALYRDEREWEIAFRLVNSFTRRGQRSRNVAVTWRNLFGEIPGVRAEDLMSHLPVAFATMGFHCQQNNTVTHDAVFLIGGSVKVVKLPEPFGKWWQIRESTPRWNEDAQLELFAAIKAHETGRQSATLDLTLSTLALPVVPLLGAALMGQLQRPLRIPSPRNLLSALADPNTSADRWVRALIGRASRTTSYELTTHRTF